MDWKDGIGERSLNLRRPRSAPVGNLAWYAGNTLYNIYNKKACNMIHAHKYLSFLAV